jgi:U3 small nucleolar RNA-associated protein 12
MVQNYLRHGPTEVCISVIILRFNCIGQAFGSRFAAHPRTRCSMEGLAYVPALEDVLVWDVKKGEMVSTTLYSHSIHSLPI